MGVLYDTSEQDRLKSSIEQYTKAVNSEDNSAEAKNAKVLRYSILIAGAVVVILGFKFLVNRLKK